MVLCGAVSCEHVLLFGSKVYLYWIPVVILMFGKPINDWQLLPNPTASAKPSGADARPGDELIFTSLTQAAAEFDLQRAGAERRFVEVSFPAETDRHPGWRDPWLGTRGAALEAEAAALASRMCELTRRGSRVWLYDGYDLELNRILTRHLEAEPKLEHVYPLEGHYYSRIVEYASR
jgi:hypothetical protein